MIFRCIYEQFVDKLNAEHIFETAHFLPQNSASVLKSVITKSCQRLLRVNNKSHVKVF